MAGNTVSSGGIGPDIAGHITSGGGNVIGITEGITGFTPAATDRTGTAATPLAPALAPLASNGGIVQTFALLAGSPAIDLAVCPAGLPAAQEGSLSYI